MPKKSFSGGLSKPAGPLSRAVQVGRTIYLSGMVGSRPGGGLAEGVGEQTRQALENVRDVLKEAGADLSDLVSVTVYLVRAEDYPAMNEAYAPFFDETLPARACVVAGMVHVEYLVEIQGVAVVGSVD